MLRVGTAGIPHTSSSHNTLSGIRRVKALGLEAMEVEFVRGMRMAEDTARAAGAVAKELDVALSAHAPYYINLASDALVKRKNSVRFIVDTARIAHHLDATPVVFHPGYYSKTSDTYALMREGIKMIRELVAAQSWSVGLAIETMGRQATFGTLDEIIRLCEEIEGIIPALDFSHMHARGNGCLRTQRDFAAVFDQLEARLGLDSYHIHFTGVEYKNGNEKRHLVMAESDLDLSLLANELLVRGCGATLISESPNLEVDALKMKAMLDKHLEPLNRKVETYD